ncbi:MAG: ATP-binding protein [Coriobacteriia bacterium]
MYLKRIIAERFGRLDSVVLGDLGPGLTVVLGPNEAGKTTFSSLVRHVLYGYPRKGAEPGYESDAGKRLGRLVFADTDGEWAIERTEGTHGGPVAVSALAGRPRPELNVEIIEGIPRDAFRVVFGFGIEEMAQIESGRGEGLDILSRLSAARAGLGVSPADVRKGFADRMSKLWLKGGQVPRLNEIKANIERTKKRLAQLEQEAADYSRQRDELTLIAARLAEAGELRDRTAGRARDLDAVARELSDLELRVDEASAQITADRSELEAKKDALARLSVDQAVLDAAPAISSVLEDLSGFRQRLERVRELESQIEQKQADSLHALEQAGCDEAAAAVANIGADTVAGIERWKSRLAVLEAQCVASERAANAAEDSAAAEPAGAPARRNQSWVPAAVFVLLGTAIALWGSISGDYVQAVLGALVVGTGIAYLVRLRGVRPAYDRSPELSAAAASARAACARDADALTAANQEWMEWLAGHGLNPVSDDPSEAAILIGAFRQHRDDAVQAETLAAARDAELRECDAFRGRLAAAAAAVDPQVETTPLHDVATLAARLRDRVEQASTVNSERSACAQDVERLEHSIHDVGQKLAAARDKSTALLESRGLSGADAARIKAEQDLAASEARAAADAYDDVMREHTALATTLDSEGRDSEMAQLRLELAGLQERRDAALDRYAVLAVAERLMAITQAYNEQTRQPAVTKRAGEIFKTITAGRFVRVVVPSDGGEFQVYDDASRATPSSKLSTGAAQQLYLALRIALIESLDESGPGLPVLMDDVFANFDPERKLGAAKAVAELAEHRQVVMFTCHPETTELFDRVEPARTMIEIDRCS